MRIILLAVFAALSVMLPAQEPLIINAYNRTAESLDGEWHYIVDPYENGFYNYRYQPFEDQENPGKGAYFTNAKPADKTDLVEYDFDKSPTLQVPGDWNTQEEKLFYYEGTVWYKKSFDYEKTDADNRVFVYFGAANYQSDVYLNGEKLGRHVGGFTPFNFEITDRLKEKDNFLIVKVDNKRLKDGVPTLNTDWWNYGGITRSVKLIETPANFIRDYYIQLDPEDSKRVKGYVQLSGEAVSGKTVRINIPELKLKQELKTNADGRAELDFPLRKFTSWSVENPKLYEVKISTGEDETVDQIGFRTIETEGPEILLNGEKMFLRGICMHEESPFRPGRAYTEADARQLFEWARELGANYVRLAHYPHNEHMVRIADEMGILLWEENPVYWTISWENEETYANAENQLSEVIFRDKNRASVIIWSMANETPTSEPRLDFLKKLAAHTREQDPTRLISAALEQSSMENDPNVQTITDPFADVVDVLSFNQYIGWYYGTPQTPRKIRWNITQNKPVLISEFGAGAKAGFHADSLTRWSEEYQSNLYRETLDMINRIEQLRGFTPWILVDFRSPRRPLPVIQEGWNRKGLISEDGQKKKAFYVLRDYYSEKALGK